MAAAATPAAAATVAATAAAMAARPRLALVYQTLLSYLRRAVGAAVLAALRTEPYQKRRGGSSRASAGEICLPPCRRRAPRRVVALWRRGATAPNRNLTGQGEAEISRTAAARLHRNSLTSGPRKKTPLGARLVVALLAQPICSHGYPRAHQGD